MKWEKVKLGDIVDIRKGQYITKKDSKEGPYPVILGGREPAYYTDKYNHIGKAIVVSRSGASAGYVSFWNEPIFITDGFLIEPKENVDIDFLYYLMKSQEGQFIGNQGGSAIPHVTPRTISIFSVCIPDIKIQKTIASILSAYDDLIENNQKQIKLLEEAAQRLYKEWFVDLRFPGHENVKIVDGVPEGWTKTRLDEITSVLKRGISPVYDDTGPFIVINQKCIRQNIVDYSESRKQSKQYAEELQLQESDTVICSTGIGTLGRVGQIYNVYQNSTFDSHVTLVRANELIGKQFLFWSLKLLQPYLMSLGKGSTNQQELYKGDLAACLLLLPKEYIMIDFEKRTQEIHDSIALKTKQISSLCEARDRLLPKLMNGEIEV